MFRDKVESFLGFAQEHLADLDPIACEGAREQRLELTSASESGRALVKLRREGFEESKRDVAVLERKGFAEESTGFRYALCV